MPINFQISTNHATEFPAFSIKYFQSWNPFDWRSNGDIWEMFECEWPLGKMFGQWIKAEEREERGEKLLLLSSCLYQPFLHPSSILWSTTCSNLNLENAERLPINPNFDQIFSSSGLPHTFTFYILISLDQKKSKKKGLIPDGAHAVPWELRIFSFTCDTFRVSSEAEEGLRFYSFSTCDCSGGSEKVKQRVPDGAHAVPWERVTNDDCSSSY